MAIAKIKKIEIIGLQDDKEKFLNLLQRLGAVELLTLQDETSEKDTPMFSEADMLEIEEALSYLATFKEKTGLFEGIIRSKPLIYEDELKEIVKNFDYRSMLKELTSLRSHLKNLIQHKDKLNQEKQLLLPWRRLNISLDRIHPTQHCAVMLGIFYARDYSKILEDLKKENIDLFFDVINQDKVNTYIVFIYLQKDFECLQAILKNYYFNFVALGHHKCTVKERLYRINSETLIFDDEIKEMKAKIASFLKQQLKLMIAYDYLGNIRRQEKADRNLAKQHFTFSLRGWIKYKDVHILEKAIAATFKDSAIFISEPEKGEEIPVDLENPRFIQPFEFITKIYGFPKYSEVDPTPYLAPFFFLYFGFCVSDAGYGFILALFSFFVLKKFKMGPQGLKFFRLFLYCGVSTIIIGALTGSWFGNLFELLADSNKIFLPIKRLKDSLVILDPMKEPTKLLGIALSFGIIQVWFGNIVAGIGNIKNRRYLDVVLDQLTMLTFLFGLTGLGLIFLKLLAPTYLTLFNYAALFGALALLFTQGRSEKSLGGKLFYGAYNLYATLSGYLSDILSYSRLWALSLVTGVMASTINLISVQFSQIFISIVPFINKINFIRILVSSFILIVIFVFGHLISFLMNLLGAFIHPLRLQFVEFFSKFFKTSGDSFKPFKVETKYVNIR